MDAQSAPMTARKSGLIVVYLSSNIAMNLLNRWMLGLYPFPFPLFMTACHMIFQFVVFFPVLMRNSNQRQMHVHSFGKQGSGLLAIGVTFAANIALNNLSLVALPLSMNQIIRSSMPVVVAMMAVALEGRIPSRLEFVALTVLCVGVATTVTQNESGEISTNGIFICGLSVVACAIMMCTSGRVMREKIDAMRLSFYTSPISALIMAPFSLYLEGEELARFFSTNGYSIMLWMLISCMISVLYNVIHSMMIHETSSTTTTVIGQVKVVLLLVFGALFLGEAKIFSPKVLMGCFLALGGFSLYSYCKLQRSLSDTALKSSMSSPSIPLLDKSVPSTERHRTISASKNDTQSCH